MSEAMSIRQAWAVPMDPTGIAVNISVMLTRLPKRGKCARCGNRRVLLALVANTGATSDGYCGRCAGTR